MPPLILAPPILRPPNRRRSSRMLSLSFHQTGVTPTRGWVWAAGLRQIARSTLHSWRESSRQPPAAAIAAESRTFLGFWRIGATDESLRIMVRWWSCTPANLPPVFGKAPAPPSEFTIHPLAIGPLNKTFATPIKSLPPHQKYAL